MKTIPLTQGQVALVDDADYEAVSQFKWFVQKRARQFYAARKLRKLSGGWTIQYMHRFLMPGVAQIDHRDGNGLNNQREGNLRPATASQNNRGLKRKKAGSTSRFRGVYWDKRKRNWRAAIKLDSGTKNLGNFSIEEDAARARDAATRKYYTDGFQQLNFP